jgi:hypothetical protein
MTCEGLTSPDDPPPVKDNGRDILESTEENEEMIPPQRMFDTDISADQDAAYSERPLHLEAVARLREIPDEFRLSTTETGQIVGSFQNFIAVALTGLFLRPIPKKNRRPWAVSHDRDQI